MNLRTPDAVRYLAERGVNRTVGTLRQWRSIGRGPAFIRIGCREVRYPTEALDAYVARIVSPLIDPAATEPATAQQ
jgi:hypothetical protein